MLIMNPGIRNGLNHERYPFAILLNFKLRNSEVLKSSLDHLDLRLEYSRKNQFAAGQTHERWQ